MKYLKHGKLNPLLLSTTQQYVLSGVVFAGNVAVLLALVFGAAKNSEVLESLALAAERAAAAKPVEPPRKAEPPVVRTATERTTGEQALVVSAPADWQWRGCRSGDSGRVEVLFSIDQSGKASQY